MKVLVKAFFGLIFIGAGACAAQTLHQYGPGWDPQSAPAHTQFYLCPPNIPATLAFGNVQVPNVPMDMPLGGLKPSYTSPYCIDLSHEQGAVALILHREKLHAEVIAALNRQSAATEKLAGQMDIWMKKAESDLRGALDAKFKSLPAELVSNATFEEYMKKNRQDTLRAFDCKQDPTKCD